MSSLMSRFNDERADRVRTVAQLDGVHGLALVAFSVALAFSLGSPSRSLAAATGAQRTVLRLELAADGTLDGIAAGAELSEVLETLARVTGAKILGGNEFGSDLVSFAFTRRDQVEAVRRILRGHSFAIGIRAGSTHGRPEVTRVAILGTRDRTNPLDVTASARSGAGPSISPASTGSAYDPGNPGARVSALDAMVTYGQEAPENEALLEAFTQAGETAARVAALEGLQHRDELTPAALLDVATDDGDLAVRARALELLRFEATPSLELYEAVASMDTTDDPAVRRAVNELLDELEGALGVPTIPSRPKARDR